MRILITNIRLADRSGTEIVVRDLALRLVERGHEVAVFAQFIGRLADELKSRGVTVVEDLACLPEVPDVIHGHHMPATGAAMCAFPQTPAIWVCHSSDAWFDAPPRFAQLRRMFAVDETCRARLAGRDALSEDAVGILPNAVDLRIFTARTAPLPARPRRAVSLVKHSEPIPLIKEACRRRGLPLTAYGHGVGNPVADIETRCLQADIVFATARTALEAMATGAAVILIDGRGFGGMVTSANYARGRRLNFGLGMLSKEWSLDELEGAIASYDPADAAEVCRRVRAEADLECAVTQLETVYRAVIDEGKATPIDPAQHRRDMLAFQRDWLPCLDRRSGDAATKWPAPYGAPADLIAAQAGEITELHMIIAGMAQSRAVRLARFVRRLLGRA